jgi:CelD/BcsL family acetyltransferase involved in cellulose biosynthesis
LPELVRFRQELGQFTDARGYLLFHAEKPIAYIFCPAQDGNLLYQFLGHDPEYERWSPGTVLQYLALESLFAEGRFRTFDFTEGEGAHKEFFANRSVLCADIYYFRKSPKNYLIVGLHAGLYAASRGATRLLDRLGLKARIKKLIRSRA